MPHIVRIKHVQCICTADCTLPTAYGRQPLPSPHIYWQVYREHKHSCFLCKFYHIRPYSLLQSDTKLTPNMQQFNNSLCLPICPRLAHLHTSPHFPTRQTFRNQKLYVPILCIYDIWGTYCKSTRQQQPIHHAACIYTIHISKYIPLNVYSRRFAICIAFVYIYNIANMCESTAIQYSEYNAKQYLISNRNRLK